MHWKITGLTLTLIATISVVALVTLMKGDAVVKGTGTIVWLDFEGGFWGIKSDDGENYDPINLDPTFQTEDLQIYFEAKIRTDLTSFHMWGKAVEILNMHKL